MNKPSRAPGKLLILLTFFLPACGSSLSSVSGDVTYDGQPVDKGRIEFSPADGKRAGGGGPIAGGKYEVKGLMPGPKIVLIIAVKAVPFARSSEEMAKRAKEAKTKGDGTGLIDPADVIPADAEGNNVTVELKPGRQTLDFALKGPGKKKAP